MKTFEKRLLIVLIIAGISCLFFSAYIASFKWFETSSVLFAIIGLLQLELTGFFDDLFKEVCDEEQFPNGPPSNIAREIIDNPDTPWLTFLKSLIFYNRKVGLSFLLISSFMQLVLIWIK